MRILITGGSGMVGKNLLENKPLRQHQLLYPTSQELNLLDRKAVLSYLDNTKPDVIIHAAGKVGGIQANIKNPVSFLTENMDMGLNVVIAAKQAGIKRLINLGSSCMYPKQAQNPLTENMVLDGALEPTNEGYALAKCTVSRLCDYIHQEDSSFLYKTLIPCNLFGRWDKFSPHNSHLLPAIIVKINEAKLNGAPTVEIWGDGSARREFMYAEDLTDFITMAVDRMDELEQLTNVGIDSDYTIKEYYQAVAEALSFNGTFQYDTTKPTGMKRKLVNSAKAHEFGWKAKTDLQNGIHKTVEFYFNEYLNKETK